LALKLVDGGNCSICKSSVIVFVYQSTLFTSVPLQAVVGAFRTGCTVGERSGDVLYSTLNHSSAIGFSYFAGVNLSTIKDEIQDFRKQKTLDGWINTIATCIYAQCNALQQGSNKDSIDSILVSTGDMIHQINQVVYTIQRVFLFRRIEIITLDVPSFLEDMKNGEHNLRLALLVGIFFDGLVAFQCARRAVDKDSREKWYKRGVSSSKMLLSFSVHSSWNWENKALLLAAEKLYTDGDFVSAASTYDKAICSANEHRFVHEEAIASELAGDFYYERNFHEKSIPFFKHSLKCYLKWGATAVALRLQNDLEVKFGLGEVQNMPTNDLLKAISSLKQQSLSRKRCESIGGD
jgi:tetratricopeptide (TPR) repeat protein